PTRRLRHQLARAIGTAPAPSSFHLFEVRTLMTLLNLVSRRTTELTGRAAVSSVAAMIGAAFAGSTLVTPLYVIYKEQFGFSQITLTLVYGAYLLGNLVALLFFGHLSDQLG